MAATPSIKVIKEFNFRGARKRFSNRYHFSGGTPANNTAWTTFSDAVVNAEKAIYEAHADDLVEDVQIVETIGYAAGSDVPVFSKTYTTYGTGAFSSYGDQAGQSAALVRYSTTQRTSKNHPIYLFNYYHGVFNQTSVSGDELNHDQKAAMTTYGGAWISGFSDGTNTLKRAGPNGAVAQGVSVATFLTHRDFPN